MKTSLPSPTISGGAHPAIAVPLLALASILVPTLHATQISWSSTAATTAWATGSNWIGGTAPTSDYTSDVAVFDQLSYANQPNTGTSQIAGLTFGGNSAAVTISGTARIGTSGIDKQAGSGAVVFLNAGRLGGGAPQTWTNNSSTDLTMGTSGTSSTFGSASGTVTLTLAGSGSGNIVIHDAIASTTGGPTAITVSRTGTGIVILTGGNAGSTYTGGTTVSSGVLLVNNTVGSGTGSGAVSVQNTGTLGGSGAVSGATTAAAGSFLSAGSGAGVAGNLTFGSTLDLSGLASGTGGLLFDLGTAGASDTITLSSGALTIGSGTLDLGDFTFTTLSGFGTGTYTLFDTSTSIVGTLGTNLTGTIGGLNAALSLANGGQDLVLTVTAIPEPSAFAALLGTLALAAAFCRRRHALRPH